MIEEEKKSNAKKMLWPTLAMMAFSTVWGFGNVVNGYVYFDGTKVIFSWILMFLLYFVPYALMVGELGATFKNANGGVSSWVNATMGAKWAYYAGWTYWACHVVYISSKGTGGLRAMAWGIFGNTKWYDGLPTAWTQFATLVVFLFFCWVTTKGIPVLKSLATIAGSSMFIMSILFIIMMFAAPAINPHAGYYSINFNWKSLMPTFNLKYLTSLSILVFAVGGCEKISPYVNKVKNPTKNFPKAMYMLAIMTGFLTIFGSFALGVFFNAHHLPDDLKMNGSYYAFQAMGEKFGMGKFFLYTFIITQALYMLAQLAVLVDGGARIFLSDTAKKYLPKQLTKTDKNGLPINGYWLTTGICSVLLFLSATLPSVNDIFNQLLNLNGIVSPYVTGLLFWAFIKITIHPEKFPSQYVFIKNKTFAVIVGWWCLIITVTGATFGIVPIDAKAGSATWWHMLILNIVEPLLMIGLGIVLPLIAKWQRSKEN